ncbi:MAG: PspC domain-containing protein, partial [Muribaculaceae bacterium]|nr:PspC domain-containing protein [Muribaculaceae bacterium]
MKRNITVNIFGSLYPMDEDAYAMLNAYITDMRDCFSHLPDGKEISDDIEGRVAELMGELRQNGTEAISIEHIEDIINRVGKPEQFIDEETATLREGVVPVTPQTPKKKLFRDPEHKLLAGVFGGLGCYMGVNPVWLRLAYLLLLFVLFINMPDSIWFILILLCAYVVCWVSVPLAATPAERLRMKGEQVNLSNLCEEFLVSTKELFSRQSNLKMNGRLASGLYSFVKWFCYAFGILLILALGAAFITLILSMVGALSYPWNSSREIFGEDFPIIVILDSNPGWLIWTGVISLLAFITLSLYLVFHFVSRVLGRVRPRSTSLKVFSLCSWIALIIVCTISFSQIGGNAVSYHFYITREKSARDKLETSKGKQKKQLAEAGWKVIKDNNIRNYINNGEHFSGNQSLNYLDAGKAEDGMVMEYEVERQQKVVPGVYRLEAKGRTNGDGAEIYAVGSEGKRYSQPVPVCGNKGGDVWKKAELALTADTAKLLPNRNYLDNLARANKSQGYGWSDIIIEDITV